MEQKLSEFRARKKAEAASKCAGVTGARPETATELSVTTGTLNEEEQTERSSSATATAARVPMDWLMRSTLGRRLAVTNVTLLKLLLWLVLLGLFSELDFGLPFFLISLFYWLYEGLRSPAARQPGELSAYSVFNPDCQPLLGALTAQQLEGEMGYRPLGDR
ncbi:SAYSvFN domain-containing protein 1 [Paramormyrops kingsleyae]|uniref:SAYSVFN motif domain containing 1 n=1 Tax=Paramormyrops kingsleyae TaxID=1676925 RepID=A0A3B3RHJ3_9TELE|nr:SAYSvFN domain-containing protein 1 [Paramormyrops kingsleyae]